MLRIVPWAALLRERGWIESLARKGASLDWIVPFSKGVCSYTRRAFLKIAIIFTCHYLLAVPSPPLFFSRDQSSAPSFEEKRQSSRVERRGEGSIRFFGDFVARSKFLSAKEMDSMVGVLLELLSRFPARGRRRAHVPAGLTKLPPSQKNAKLHLDFTPNFKCPHRIMYYTLWRGNAAVLCFLRSFSWPCSSSSSSRNIYLTPRRYESEILIGRDFSRIFFF